jgi:hypothetical protein
MHVPLIFAPREPRRRPPGRGERRPPGHRAHDLRHARSGPDPAMGGRSLAGALRGEDLESAPQYLENYSTYLSFGWSPLVGLVEGSMKLIKAPRSELYALHDDEHERTNLLAGESEAVAKRVNELTVALDGILAGHPPRESIAHEIAVTDSAREHLQKLGYVGGRSRPSPGRAARHSPIRRTDRAGEPAPPRLPADEGRPVPAGARAAEAARGSGSEQPSVPRPLRHPAQVRRPLRGSTGRAAERALAGRADRTTYFNLGEVHLQLEQPSRPRSASASASPHSPATSARCSGSRSCSSAAAGPMRRAVSIRPCSTAGRERRASPR